MAVNLEIVNLQKKIPIHPPKIKKVLKSILEHEKVFTGSLSVVFVVDRKIREINQHFLNHAYATDVITFDLNDRGSCKEGKGGVEPLAGEIIISTTTAVRQAKEFATTTFQEIVLYMIHGILHLLGYDDHRPQDRLAMRRKEAELLQVVGRKFQVSSKT